MVRIIRVVPDPDPQNPRKDDNLGTMVCKHDRHNLGDEEPDWHKVFFDLFGCREVTTKKLLEILKSDGDLYSEYRSFCVAQAHNFRSTDAVFDFLFDPTVTNYGEYSDLFRRALVLDRMKPEDVTPVDRLFEELLKGGVFLPLYLYDHSGLSLKTYPVDTWDTSYVGFVFSTNTKSRYNYGARKWSRNLVEEVLNAEIEAYDMYLSSEIYGLQIYNTPEDLEAEEPTEEVWGFYGDNWRSNGMKNYVKPEEYEALEKACSNIDFS